MALKECTKKEEANTYELTVEVDGETFERAVNTVYKKQVKNINIQGFRKGKAPRRIIEKMYGSEVFYEDAMQDCYPDALYEAAKEKDLKIVSVNSLEAVEAGKDGFTFKTVIVVERLQTSSLTRRSTRSESATQDLLRSRAEPLKMAILQ